QFRQYLALDGGGDMAYVSLKIFVGNREGEVLEDIAYRGGDIAAVQHEVHAQGFEAAGGCLGARRRYEGDFVADAVVVEHLAIDGVEEGFGDLEVVVFVDE